ncbi:MAG: SoxR reducing system RseC family protein [Paludibacter sp.]|nr:SoxR reducing system RseC family protein [Paludibacter sp.]
MSQQIEHTGTIHHIQGHHIQVLITQLSACSSCHANGACSAADKDDKIIEVETSDPSFRVGDRVMLYGQTSMGLQAVLLAFVIPFLIILVTLFILRLYITNEALSGIIALSALLPYYFILFLFNKKMKSKFQFFIKKETQDS